MSEFRVNSITNQDGSAGPQVCGVSTFSGKSGVQIPSGSTDFRRQDGGGRGRGVIAGGYNYPSGEQSQLQLIEIATRGNATDFGDLKAIRYSGGGCSSSTRGIYVGGRKESPFTLDTDIQFITMASQGGANDFGDISFFGTGLRAVSNNTRGLAFGGVENITLSPTNTINKNIEFFTIASTGDGTDFGELTLASYAAGTASSPTRGISAGGQKSPLPQGTLTIMNVIEFMTFSTLGNAQDFGDLSLALRATSGASNATRAIFAGGYNASPIAYNQGSNQIQFITMASEGNGTDFGDLAMDTSFATSVSNSTRGVVGDGPNSTSHSNAMDFITISTTGDAVDFGDMATKVIFSSQNISDAHGGLAQ